ncbi:MAG: GAF domain-containing protein [Sporichthyaceae bacterium]
MADQRGTPGDGHGSGHPYGAVSPRLELDQLLGQLVERARDVRAAHHRLQGLLEANSAIIGDLSLTVVLRRIVEAACGLVQAGYGALGVLAPGGGLAEFIHVGMDAGAVARIGRLPTGGGLLGALIDDPRPIRLAKIGSDARSVGFPAGHPPMSSFLGVPIRVRDEVFGNLYLSESAAGEFSAEDEQMVIALAATAGVVIENARLFEAAQRRQRWLESSVQITRDLISPSAGDPLIRIAEGARAIADADIATVVLPGTSAGELRIEVAAGARAQALSGVVFPMQGTLAEAVFAKRIPILLADAGASGSYTVHLRSALDVGPVMAAPLLGADGIRGVLTLGRLSGRAIFDAEDLNLATSFANHAALALELVDARTDHQRMELLEDRDRIARDLHDHVIARLFAAGMSLQAVAVGLDGDERGRRVAEVVEDLDATMSAIRTSIFGLRGALGPGGGPSLRERILEVVGEVTPLLSRPPTVHFSGPTDTGADEEIVADLVAVARESLTNVARHAGADRVELRLDARSNTLTLEVLDDGVGLGANTRRSGLANLRRRAQSRGGQFEVGPAPAGHCPNNREGTHLRWTIPLR